MKIELKHKVTKSAIALQTPHNDPDKPFKPKVTGGSFEKKIFLREIGRSYGFYGHSMNLESTTNLDLGQAVRSLPSFDVVSIDPPQIKPNPLPPGAMS